MFKEVGITEEKANTGVFPLKWSAGSVKASSYLNQPLQG